MKSLLKISALVLAVSMMCALLCGCTENEEASETQIQVSIETDDGFYGYKLPDGVNYEGRTVKVLTTAVNTNGTCYQIKPEDNPDYSAETTTAVLTSASECTKLVEELLGVTVEEEVIFTSSRYGGPMYERMMRDAMSFTGDYLFAMPCLNEAAMLAADGLLYDLKNVVDLDNPWWCQPFNDTVTIADKCYFATGDIGTVSMESTMFVAFNKRLEESYGLAKKYGYNSLYEMVDQKAWTQDVMFEMAKEVYADSNENNKADPEDMIGLSAQENVVYWLLRAGNVRICDINEEGYPELSINNERAISLITNAQEHIQDPALGMIIADDYLSQKLPINPATQVFIDGNCLFYFNSLGNLTTLRTMEDDFGVLPCPLYDSTQENYSNNVGSWTSNCVCIPTAIDAKDLELTGHFLEALGAVSRAKLTPTYYEQTLQYQVSRDDESMRMLDIINANRSPELAEMYRWGNMMATVAGMRIQPVGTFVSAYEKIEKQTLNAIEETVNTFKELEH